MCSYVNGVDYICLLEAAYNQMVTAMNRALPVAIAVYRSHWLHHHLAYLSSIVY